MSREEPIRAAERALEDHEVEVCDELLKRLLRDLPPHADPVEMVQAVRSSMLKDPENRDLLMRVTLMAHYGGYGVRQRLDVPLDSPSGRRAHALFDEVLRREEVEVIARLSEMVDERLGTDASPSERSALSTKLSTENREFARLAARLDFLSDSRGERSLARVLARLSQEEEAD